MLDRSIQVLLKLENEEKSCVADLSGSLDKVGPNYTAFIYAKKQSRMGLNFVILNKCWFQSVWSWMQFEHAED